MLFACTLNRRLFALAGVFTALAACSTTPGPRPESARATLAILATTDLHGHVLGYDYYRLRTAPEIGLDRLAPLIAQARQEFANTLLVDNGDTLQGNAMADLQAGPLLPPCDQPLAMHKAMNHLRYDAGVPGNHEFNFGLPFLRRVTGQVFDASGARCAGPDFPLVLSNVTSVADGQPLFAPSLLLERQMTVTGADGEVRQLPLRIGVIGTVPTAILLWDRAHLDGEVIAESPLAAARREAAALRARGADIVLLLSHGGIETSPYSPLLADSAWHLARDAGIDALVMGHQHDVFPEPDNPDRDFADIDGVDHQRGSVHGVPAVMASSWGRALGVLELALVWRDGRWQVDRDRSHASLRGLVRAGAEPLAVDPAIAALVADEHAATIAEVSRPIGHSDFAMSSCFAAAGDVTALQVVNLVQAQTIRGHVQAGLPAYRDLPVLSAASPFRSGRAGPDDYTRIPAGDLAVRNAADLYVFPNTLVALAIDGATLKAWLEHSARWFRRIDPADATPQVLIDSDVPGYNFDVIHGVDYVIDVTRPVGDRIVTLNHQGRPVQPTDRFVIATNNYRAGGGGGFPGTGAAMELVIDTQTGSRELVVDWLRRTGQITRAQHGSDLPWRFAPIHTAGEVVFDGCRDALPEARAAGLDRVRLAQDQPDSGRSRYSVDLAH